VEPPTGAATYERARRRANIAVWTIHLQCRRLTSAEPEDGEFLFRKWADFDFLVVALSRLRRAAALATRVPEVAPRLTPALARFDSALPFLKTMRDVAEHFDDYAVDRGRKSEIHRTELEVSGMSMDGTTLEWLGGSLNIEEASAASDNLFAQIKEAASAFPPRA
jgi:hypothetical protein